MFTCMYSCYLRYNIQRKAFIFPFAFQGKLVSELWKTHWQSSTRRVGTNIILFHLTWPLCQNLPDVRSPMTKPQFIPFLPVLVASSLSYATQGRVSYAIKVAIADIFLLRIMKYCFSESTGNCASCPDDC